MKYITEKTFSEKLSHLAIHKNLTGIEKSWFMSDNKKALAVIVQDYVDSDYGYVIFKIGHGGLFEFDDCKCSYKDYDIILDEVCARLDNSLKVSKHLFIPKVGFEKRNHEFEHLRTISTYAHARVLMKEIYYTYNDKDGNFIDQFQSSAFDARVFELYLYAYFSREGYEIKDNYTSPDFNICKYGLEVSIEAVTANASCTELNTPYDGYNSLKSEDLKYEDIREENAIKYYEIFNKKLARKYWLKPHCQDKPFVIAIQDFHREFSLFHGSDPLFRYLYGFDVQAIFDDQNKIRYVINKFNNHKYKNKIVNSGLFANEDTENVSAILFTNAGTVAKFTRIAFQSGYQKDSIDKVIRCGYCFNHDPDALRPQGFYYEVGDPKWLERWGQGLIVFHNPLAKFPIPHGYFCDALEYFFENDVLQMVGPHFFPLSSYTVKQIIRNKNKL